VRESSESIDERPHGVLGERPRLLVIDRFALVVAAMSRLLSGPPLNAEVIATTRSSDALTIIEQNPVELVICEVKSQPLSGPELANRLATDAPAIRMIMVADSESEPLLPAALHSGAAGFFMKESAPEEFIAGVAAVLQGQCVIGRGLLGRALSLLASEGGGRADERLGQLSPAECSILALIAQAQSVRAIAEVKGISPKTVRNHLAVVYRKLKVRNRAEAMLCAARLGIVPLGPS
jgi:DNA-binding NarL/FixJ family response regulator